MFRPAVCAKYHVIVNMPSIDVSVIQRGATCISTYERGSKDEFYKAGCARKSS